MSRAPRVRKAVVLGAGTMGAQVAAHLAAQGIETALLDLPASGLSLKLGDRRGVLPYTVLVDAGGTIRATRAGTFPDRAALDSWLEQSLAD